MQPVADGELATRLFAGVNHLLAFFDRHFHRFLAQDVLPGFCRLDGVFGVQPIRRDDVHHINVGIVRHLFHGVVVVNIFVGNVVLRLPTFRLGGMAGDNAGEPAILRLLQRGCELVGAQIAQPGEGESDFPVRLGGAGTRSQRAGK